MKKISQTTLKNYVAGVEGKSLGMMFRKEMAIASDKDKNYIMDYQWLISTVVGVIILLLLVTYCMDIAVRSIKLAFLQLIAPIPVISYIDPKSGKDGLFKKWYETCFKTYLSLFIRLLVIYLAVYIISIVSDLQFVDVITGEYQTGLLIKVFIIIGALMFAKQLPEILKGLGIKLDGDGKFTLNPLRKVENQAIGGKYLKKPNDMLEKAGKAIVKSPISGASLLGKKVIGGIDAAKNGKGFKQGWNRTHGKLHNNFYKKLDEWAPDSAEARKNERLGREEVKALNTKWSRGKAAADKLNEYAGRTGKPFNALDGKDYRAYKTVYKNDEFIKSRMNLDAKDAEQKVLQRISEMTMRGTSIENAIKAEQSAIDEIGGKFKTELKSLADRVTSATGAAVEQERAAVSAKMTKKLDDTTKAVSGMEKVH